MYMCVYTVYNRSLSIVQTFFILKKYVFYVHQGCSKNSNILKYYYSLK